MKKEKKKNQKFNSDTSSNSLFLDKNPILKIIVKSILLILILSIGIVVSDRKGYFDPDQTNNHTKKKRHSPETTATTEAQKTEHIINTRVMRE